MIKPTFNWDQATWKSDYDEEYNKVKIASADSTAKYFPDYELDLFLRTDASEVAVAAVLLQIIKGKDGKDTYHPIGFKSKKLTRAAVRWDIHKKEAYEVYYRMKCIAYYLHGKSFIAETDHRNLLWMTTTTRQYHKNLNTIWSRFMEVVCSIMVLESLGSF